MIGVEGVLDVRPATVPRVIATTSRASPAMRASRTCIARIDNEPYRFPDVDAKPHFIVKSPVNGGAHRP